MPTTSPFSFMPSATTARAMFTFKPTTPCLACHVSPDFPFGVVPVYSVPRGMTKSLQLNGKPNSIDRKYT